MRLFIIILLIVFSASSLIDNTVAFELSNELSNELSSELPNKSDTEKPAAALIERSEELIIDPRLIFLMQLSEKSPDAITDQLASLQAEHEPLNGVAQYLFLSLKAIVASRNGEFKQAVELLKEAQKFTNAINKNKFNNPKLNKLILTHNHMLLANSYVALKDFNNAYLVKKSYYDYSQYFTQDQHNKHVELINEKYKTKHKLHYNELLESQNKLKKLALADANAKNKTQQINGLLIIATIAVFLLLYFLQLKVRKKLVLLATTDGLTRLANRRSLFEYGQKLIATLDEIEPKLSLLVVDVDHFKKINNQYGHNIGDQVLKIIAIVGNEVMRSRDVFARLRGNEFVAILPDVNSDEAKAIAEHLKEKIGEFNFSVFGIKESLSVSIGISSVSPKPIEFEHLLHAADLAMYHAKSLGRGQVAIYQTFMNSSER